MLIRLFLLFLLFSSGLAADGNKSRLDGLAIMQNAMLKPTGFPYVYEEQSLILMDKSGNRDVRNARRYTRAEEDGTVRILLVFDSPEEVKGVALLASKKIADTSLAESGIYLPAFEKRLITTSGKSHSDKFLGSDFSIYDLQPENIDDFVYRRLADAEIDEYRYFQVESTPVNDAVFQQTGYFKRVHTISKDRFLILKTDYFDRYNRLYKTLTRHEFQQYDQRTWWPNMLLMDNYQDKHQTLIKINKRVFSPDYVPRRMFSPRWLFDHQHMASTVKHLFDNTLTPVEQESEAGQ